MKEIILTQGKVALVDDEDFERVNQFKWCANWQYKNWYAVRGIKKVNSKQTMQYMHRFILNTPKGLQTDHQNHNGLDNRKCNLRSCTNTENQHNRKKQKGTSKYKGVAWYKQYKKWMAQIRLNGRRIYIGYYIDEIIAAKAYDVKAKKLYGNFAYLNFK